MTLQQLDGMPQWLMQRMKAKRGQGRVGDDPPGVWDGAAGVTVKRLEKFQFDGWFRLNCLKNILILWFVLVCYLGLVTCLKWPTR